MNRFFFIVSLIALLLGACSLPANNVDSNENIILDDLGRQVSLPPRITRAVSLAPSITESIFAAGAGDKLVGVTTFCNFPEQARAIQKVGDTMTPNIETIVALRPEVVFVSTASQLESFMTTLQQQGISVYVTDPKDLDGVFDNLIAFGELFGTSETADTLVRELRARTEKLAVANQGKATKVFVQISNDPLFTVGEGSFLTHMLPVAGAISVTADVPTAYPKLSKETAAALAPDAIVLSESDDNREPNVVFKNSPAVRNKKVFRISADILSRPGPRSVDALEQLSKDLN